ncbi:FBD-associated F-box protein At5g22730-like [Rhododendron vialii]|uniref:FBD-associated F-box protein At5g22730-like n=1 Tax=Rhododendron vialii TaxID=182163 RepID=UPI00265DB499|nr:FBD-associated F-box protein At5g22730-like [Rhododendron vialii]
MGISKVQSLHLYSDIPEAVLKLDSELPMFHNLTSLVLGAGYVLRKWWLQFLEKSPCLESLVFKEGDWIDESNGYGWDEDVDEDEDNNKYNVPSCLLLNLKEIKFVDIEANAVDLRMVEYFLKNAGVLEKLTIEIFNSIDDGSEDVAEQQLEVARSLLMLPRSSRTCQIEFSSPW